MHFWSKTKFLPISALAGMSCAYTLGLPASGARTRFFSEATKAKCCCCYSLTPKPRRSARWQRMQATQARFSDSAFEMCKFQPFRLVGFPATDCNHTNIYSLLFPVQVWQNHAARGDWHLHRGLHWLMPTPYITGLRSRRLVALGISAD